MRHLPWIVLLSAGIAGAAGVFFLSEGRRLGARNHHLQERCGALEQRGLELERRADRLAAELAGALERERDLALAFEDAAAVAAGLLGENLHLGARASWLARTNRRLEGELQTALGERDAFNRHLDERVEAIRAALEERDRRAAEAFGPMPEGVRLTLAALNQCLAEDGFPHTRFLWAREIAGRELLGVELLEHDPSTLASTLYLAERVTLHLDRELGQLTMRLAAGQRLAGGEQAPLPEAGAALAFADVSGPMWETRAGHLLQAEGSYPAPAGEDPTSRHDLLARYERDQWLARFERLLRGAGTDVAYRVEKIGGLRDAAFRDVLLLGYQDGKTLKLAIEASTMSVALSESADTVELVLADGVMRKSGGETRIDARGYSILLPDVTPARAANVMMGMVVRR